MSNGNGGGLKLSDQTSFRSAVTGIGAAVGGLVGYLVARWLGDKEIAGYILAIFVAVAGAIANYATPIAERAAKAQAADLHAENATAISENKATIADVAVAAGVPCAVPPDDTPPKPSNGGLTND